MDSDEPFLSTCVADGCQLRCTFRQAGDLLQHIIEFVRDSQTTPILVSDGGAGDGPWPPSPPWQECRVHQPALLFVGRAGTSHWSMSVSRDETTAAIVFDVACRVRQAPDFLGTTYTFPRTDFQGGSPSPAVARMELEIRPRRIGGPSLRLTADELDAAPSASIELAGDRIVIGPSNIPPAPATVRWKYRMAMSGVNQPRADA